MTTNDMFKKIYQELKEALAKSKTSEECYFLNTYIIPSINYNAEDKTLDDHYFASGIEMEIHYMLKNFNGEIDYWSYQDTYYFSNDLEMVKERIQQNLEDDMEI